MSAPPSATGEPITNKRQLVEYFALGCKPASEWRIGTEHEKFIFRRSDLRIVPYDGPDGIRALLEGLTRYGWEPVLENGNPIALSRARASISLEPGGQFELSGAPLETLHETHEEIATHLAETRSVTAELGDGMLGIGFNPKWRRADIPWMPKGRYKIMREYMPKKGSLGHDMMLRTCTVQVNLDFASEADMVKKARVGLALQPVATALFACSPFVEGKPSGFQSYRSHVWTDVDPDRSGILPFVFEPGFGFERYVDYLLDMPMYFVFRDGAFVDTAGQSFRDFIAGRLPARPGEVPSIGDWSNHLATAFPEIRLKRFLEMRGADCPGSLERLVALSALWTGLYYDQAALDAAADLIADWTAADHAYLRREVPRQGLRTSFRLRNFQAVALEVLDIARGGLRRRGRCDAAGDETRYLAPLIEIAETGQSLADKLLAAFHGEWRENIDPIFSRYAF
jgi:glutamate--cysteine ligase